MPRACAGRKLRQQPGVFFLNLLPNPDKPESNTFMHGHRKHRIPLKEKISFRENPCSFVAKTINGLLF
jgi:hypothetical protein